jgi:hypothetical protein
MRDMDMHIKREQRNRESEGNRLSNSRHQRIREVRRASCFMILWHL